MLQIKKLLSIIVYLLLVLTFLSHAQNVKGSENNNFILISIDHLGNREIKPRFKDLPHGETYFEEIPFLLPIGEDPKYICSQAAPLPDFPKEFIFPTDIVYPREIYLLLNGGNVYENYLDLAIGEVELYFSNQTTFTGELKVGFNIRDWILDKPGFVHTVNDPNIKQAWQGTTAAGNGPVIIDMLKIPIPEIYRQQTLEKITLRDISLETIPHADPALQFFAITVKTNPPPSPIVLLPGFTASWNLKAIAAGVASGNWERVPIFWPYYNLQHTLTSTEAGYEESKNYFEFYYDWRKRIDDLADDFNDYLSKTVLVNQPSETKVNLIGHSMGGLIARAYANKYGGEKIEKLITVGSPHQGVLESYYAREGGVADERFSFKNIILRLLLEIHRSKYSNTKELVNNMILSVKDMFPIFDFLKTQEGTVIDINSLSIQNDYLKNLVDPETLKPKTINIHGKENNPNKDTSEYYRIIEAPPEYKLQGLWPDGFPYDKEYTENGDLTVLTKSALTPTASSSAQVDGDHIEIIESALGIQAILDALGITGVTPNTNYTSPIVRGLLFLLGSPANIKVITPNNDQVGHDVPSPGLNTYYSEANKLIYIPNAPSGDYYVELSGTNEGIYHLYTGQLTDDEDVWQTIKGKIGKYEIVPLYLNFNPQNPQENMIKDENGETLLKLTKQQLEDLNEYARINISHSTVKRKLQYQFGKIIKIIDKALNYLEDHNYFQGSLYASSALNQSLRLRITLNQYLKQEKITSEKANYLKNELEETAKLLSSAWVNLYQKAGKTITSKKLSRYQSALEKIKVRLETDIENKVSQGEDKNLGKAYFNAISFWNKAEEYTQENKLEEAYINYFTSRLYLLETTKLLH